MRDGDCSTQGGRRHVHAVVSLRDPHHYEQVERLWSEPASRFGLQGVCRTPYLHFSYRVAAGFDAERLAGAPAEVARCTAPFRVGTAGLGLFTGPHPVLYIPVVPQLTAFHARLWERIAPAATGIVDY